MTLAARCLSDNSQCSRVVVIYLKHHCCICFHVFSAHGSSSQNLVRQLSCSFRPREVQLPKSINRLNEAYWSNWSEDVLLKVACRQKWTLQRSFLWSVSQPVIFTITFLRVLWDISGKWFCLTFSSTKWNWWLNVYLNIALLGLCDAFQCIYRALKCIPNTLYCSI